MTPLSRLKELAGARLRPSITRATNMITVADSRQDDSLAPSLTTTTDVVSHSSLLAVSCEAPSSGSGEESRAICGNNTDTWGDVGQVWGRGRGWGCFTPLLSGLKIQTQILNYVKEATLAVWQSRVICMQTF